ncbi:hypothetical protein QEN19_000976 [Hanseniaspora menglaensis]
MNASSNRPLGTNPMNGMNEEMMLQLMQERQHRSQQQQQQQINPNMINNQQHSSLGSAASVEPSNNNALMKYMVKDVVKNNFYKEFSSIRELVTKYNVVSINVESAGTLARPIGKFRGKRDYVYQTIKVNVDLFNVFKIGISLCDQFGNKPEGIFSTWQLHFQVDPETEMVPSEFLDFLDAASTIPETSASELKNTGINLVELAVLLTDSGLLMNNNVTWISHSGAYDFAYLLRLVSNKPLPSTRELFLSELDKFFPNYYDLDLINQRLNYQIFMLSGMKDELFLPPQHLEMLADGLQIPQLPHYKTTGGVSLLILITYNHLCALTKKKFPDERDFSYIKNMLSSVSMDKENNNFVFIPKGKQQPQQVNLIQQPQQSMVNAGNNNIPAGFQHSGIIPQVTQQNMQQSQIPPSGGNIQSSHMMAMPPNSNGFQNKNSNSTPQMSMVNHLQNLQMQHNNRAPQWQ